MCVAMEYCRFIFGKGSMYMENMLPWSSYSIAHLSTSNVVFRLFNMQSHFTEHYVRKKYGYFEFDGSNTSQISWDKATFTTV